MVRPEASVTSSDEDKLDGGPGNEPNQSAAVPSSSGTASPTPSSNTLTQHMPSGSQMSQHRVRPTPIVWDQQPSSSSSVPIATPRPAVVRRGAARGTVPGRPPPLVDAPNLIAARGFRPLRGAQQSARRSRPNPRMRGSPFSRQ